MMTMYLNLEGSSPPASPILSNQKSSALESSTSRSFIIRSSSTSSLFGQRRASRRAETASIQATPVSSSAPEISSSAPPSTRLMHVQERTPTPPFPSEGESKSNRRSITESYTRSETPLFTPESTPFTLDDGYDPDRPLPSVERELSLASSRQSTPSTTLYTPPTSTRASSIRKALDQDDLLEQVGGLQKLRLSSPRRSESSSSRQATPTPFIHVTASPPPNESSQSRTRRTDSLVGGVRGLQIESLRADSLGASRQQESRSPSPSRRRRSSRGINKDIYKIENETPPAAVFYMPEIQGALADARGLTAEMVRALSSSSLHREHGSSIQSLYRQALRLDEFELPSSRIVGLVGDSGVGKSSLINSLLDKAEFARASSNGTACTCAVTEYLFHDRDDFVIHVDYFPLAELKKQFEELLTAYREYQSPLGNPSGGDGDDSDKINSQMKADLARETLKASFGTRLEQTPTILSSMPFERAVEKMVEWTSQLLPQQGSQGSFDTVESCSTRLRELTSESDGSVLANGSRTCWPFIQKLRVYLKSYILSKGLIIADLPGLRDLNSARKAITERYVRQCHQIFVVAKIDRAITDESIKEILGLASRANLSKIDVVCTRSEEIQMREARYDWPAESATIEEMQSLIDADKEKSTALKEELDEYMQDSADLDQEEAQHYMQLQQDYHNSKKSKEKHELDLLRCIMKLRNSKVSEGLRKEYCSQLIAKTMKTFCVSNKMYWDNRESPVPAALPYFEVSGIPDLRQYCIGIVADSHLRATREFIKDEIPAFLGSVELWVEAGSGNGNAERKQQILDALSQIQEELDELKSPASPLNSISRVLGEEYQSHIHLHMRQRGPQWTSRARDISLDWQGWHHSSYKAFCSNYGDHSTAKMGHRCWNEEAMTAMKGDMLAVWNRFAVELQTDLERTNDAAVQAFDKSLGVVGAAQVGKGNNPRPAMRILAAAMHNRKELAIYGIENATESFNSELSSLHTDAFSSIRTAFIGKLVQNTYHDANMEYGTGSDRRRKTLITGGFGSPSLFQGHQNHCREKFRNIARLLQDKVKEIVYEQVELVEADLELLRSENVVLESERNPEFRGRVATEVERVRSKVERIGHVVEGVA